jgi:SRSO17 transposase
MRWHIERDYQDLKQQFGLRPFGEREWRRFSHHARLCMAAYGFLVAPRLIQGDSKQTPTFTARLPYPRTTFRAAT